MIREIKIKAALNGYIATVGCQTLVFNERAVMLKELDAYLEKPDETEKRYREQAVNRDLLNIPTATAALNEASPANEAAPSGAGSLGVLLASAPRRSGGAEQRRI